MSCDALPLREISSDEDLIYMEEPPKGTFRSRDLGCVHSTLCPLGADPMTVSAETFGKEGGGPW